MSDCLFLINLLVFMHLGVSTALCHYLYTVRLFYKHIHDTTVSQEMVLYKRYCKTVMQSFSWLDGTTMDGFVN